MALVNTMYQYSLIAFLEVFGLSLKKSLPDSILLKRLKNIMDTLTFNIYNYGCTGEGRGRKCHREDRNLAGLVPACPFTKGCPERQLLNHIFSGMRFTGPKSHLLRYRTPGSVEFPELLNPGPPHWAEPGPSAVSRPLPPFPTLAASAELPD